MESQTPTDTLSSYLSISFTHFLFVHLSPLHLFSLFLSLFLSLLLSSPLFNPTLLLLILTIPPWCAGELLPSFPW